MVYKLLVGCSRKETLETFDINQQIYLFCLTLTLTVRQSGISDVPPAKSFAFELKLLRKSLVQIKHSKGPRIDR